MAVDQASATADLDVHAVGPDALGSSAQTVEGCKDLAPRVVSGEAELLDGAIGELDVHSDEAV